MPYGFVGKASKKYLEAAAKAVNAAGEVHSHYPFSGCSGRAVPPPSLPERRNQPLPYKPGDALSGGCPAGIGSQTNIAVSRGAYEDILGKIRMVDEKAAEELGNVMLEIEEMCAAAYIVPETLPRYLNIVDYVKNSLAEFRSLTEDSVDKAGSFVEKVINIG
jgi:hypothetical protein